MSSSRHAHLVLYRRLLRQSRPYWLHFAGILLFGLLSTPLALLAPLPITIAVDSVLEGRPLPGFLTLVLPSSMLASSRTLLIVSAGLVVVITLLRHIQSGLNGLLNVFTSERLLQDFRAEIFKHVQRLSLSYHDSRGTTESAYRIQYDAYCIHAVTLNGLIGSITAFATLVGMVVIAVRVDLQLSLVALAVAPPLFLLSRVFRQPLRRRWREIKHLDSRSMGVVQETLGALRVVKAFGRERQEHDRFLSHSRRRLSEQLNVTTVQALFDTLVGMTTAIGTAAVLWIGIRHVQAGILTLGELLLVLAYLGQLHGPLVALSKITTDMQSAMVSAERVYALFDETPEVVERPNARSIDRARGAIAFRNVAFAYSDGRPVLQHVTIDVPEGTRVGISGQTGAGKTTLISLLMRFYDPADGVISLDGVDLRDYRLEDLRRQFALVLQEPVLFSATIAENIAYGRPNATEAEIVNAAKLANAHEFITHLTDGYQTMVGERGMRLSGGERQRVSLARAFLKDAPILLLDEPTSSLDTRTEASIIEAMERLMVGRTTVMIAHRLSTLEACTLRLHLEDGVVNAHTVSGQSRNALGRDAAFASGAAHE